jgi:GNAT superfamily N-acetyltransferase
MGKRSIGHIIVSTQKTKSYFSFSSSEYRLNQRFFRSKTMSLLPKFDIRLMQKDDYDQVLSLFMNSFFQDEPITQCLQLTETLQLAKDIINDCSQDQCSFLAFHTETKQIVAVCLNEIVDKNHKNERIQADEKNRFLFQIFADVHKNVNIFDELNADRLLHVFIISVDKSARGHGLASRLISKSIEHAKQIQLGGAFAEATGLISLKCFKQQEFQVFDELIYVNYNPERLANLNNENYDRCYLVGRKF